MTPERGELCLVLHSHMPYVEGFGTWPFGEEWLWEALATSYLPVLRVIRAAGQPLTLGITPVLADQLETLTGSAGERFLTFLRDVRAGVHRGDADGLDRAGEPALADEVRRAADDYVRADRAFSALGGDVLGAVRTLASDRPVELMGSAATHAVLPMLATRAGQRLQVAAGRAAHARRFGRGEGAFWLPECAYVPGLERMLGAEGVRAFLVDQTEALGLGAAAHLTPIATEGGPVAVPLDWATVARVWDPERGYPAHPAYRDYHHRTVFDHRPWANGGGTYDHEAALAQARRHAREFVAAIVERLDRHRSDVGRPGLVVCPLDTELLGHWWYEGPAWLAAVLAEAPRQGLALSTLSDALTRHPAVPRSLAPSSWGRPKDLSTWDGPPVAGLAALARGRELALVGRAPQAPAGRRGILARAARELLALQSSDWAFLATYRSAGPYPRERAHLHAAALDDCLGALTDSEPVAPPTEPALRNLAPALDLAPLLAP